MATPRTWMLKAPPELKVQLDKIRIARIKNGKDTEMTPYKRLCLAMARHERLLNDLIIADFVEEKKR